MTMVSVVNVNPATTKVEVAEAKAARKMNNITHLS